MRNYFLILSMFINSSLFADGGKSKNDTTSNELEIVFCFDLSGSTNGLIEDFRDHFWYITNQLNAMNPRPTLRMGLVGFSRPSFGKNNSYIKVLSDITADLDAISAVAFTLRRSIEKGDQFVVPAIQTCLGLNWSKSSAVKQMIIIVGNGMANTNGADYTKIAENAAQKEITIHTLYVSGGGNKIKEFPVWRRIADLSGGLTTEITVNQPDTAVVWEGRTESSVRHNNKLVQSIRWNAMDETCKLNSASCDSGAFEAKGDEWMNRISYKADAMYYNYLQRCGAFSTYDGKPQEALGDDVFSKNIRESITTTQKLLKECNDQAPFSRVKEHHKLYLDGELRECGSLRRAVILIAMAKWGEIPSPFQ